MKGVRYLNGISKDEEREKKKRWLQEHKMLQDELLRLKFEMVAEGKEDEEVEVKSPYVDSILETEKTSDEETPLPPTVKGDSTPRGTAPTIPKPPGLAEHIAKILEHESKIRRMKYHMGKEEKDVASGVDEGVSEKEESPPEEVLKEKRDIEKAPAHVEKPTTTGQGISESPGGPPRQVKEELKVRPKQAPKLKLIRKKRIKRKEIS